MFQLIGGPARCGKTILAHQAEAFHAGQTVSLDCLRAAFIPFVSEAIRETLTAIPAIPEHNSDEWLSALRKRDYATWPGVKAYLAAAAENNDDVLAEGALWPDYITELELAYRAVFLVDTSPSHVDRLIAMARNESTANNWMRQHDDNWIRTWAEYNVERSKLYKQLAHEHNQSVFDIADGGIEQAQAAALKYLFPDNPDVSPRQS